MAPTYSHIFIQDAVTIRTIRSRQHQSGAKSPNGSPTLMYCFHRSRLRADLGILYDRGVDFCLILDGRFVLGWPWLNLTDRGQYQTGLIFSTTTTILLVS